MIKLVPPVFGSERGNASATLNCQKTRAGVRNFNTPVHNCQTIHTPLPPSPAIVYTINNIIRK
jgi:hypothetical protein